MISSARILGNTAKVYLDGIVVYSKNIGGTCTASWCSKLKHGILTSIAEAKYYSLYKCCKYYI